MRQGEVFFNDIPNAKTYKIALDGKVTEFIADSKKANGQALAPDGRIYNVVDSEAKIVAYDAAGKGDDHRGRDSRQ